MDKVLNHKWDRLMSKDVACFPRHYVFAIVIVFFQQGLELLEDWLACLLIGKERHRLHYLCLFINQQAKSRQGTHLWHQLSLPSTKSHDDAYLTHCTFFRGNIRLPLAIQQASRYVGYAAHLLRVLKVVVVSVVSDGNHIAASFAVLFGYEQNDWDLGIKQVLQSICGHLFLHRQGEGVSSGWVSLAVKFSLGCPQQILRRSEVIIVEVQDIRKMVFSIGRWRCRKLIVAKDDFQAILGISVVEHLMSICHVKQSDY